MNDMDIPMPGELEWLEANSHLPEEDYDYFEPPEPYPEHEDDRPLPEEEERMKQPVIKFGIELNQTVDNINFSPSETLINVQKRTRSEDEVVLECFGEKRGRFDGKEEEEDQDWLRYSEVRENDVENVAEEETVEAEKFVSRFASEIDGEFMPVTGLNGDRVYAKICRSDRVGHVQKLDARTRDSGGNVL